jgi:hypothetical protein
VFKVEKEEIGLIEYIDNGVALFDSHNLKIILPEYLIIFMILLNQKIKESIKF